MQRLLSTIESSIRTAIQELKSNKLRSFLSLSGITIGIFCIVAIFTVLDSMEQNIKNTFSALGSDVLYISKWPWMDNNGEFRWWDYMRRPAIGLYELDAVENKSRTAEYSCLLYSQNDITTSHIKNKTSGITGYAVTKNFDKVQNFDISRGRYFNINELEGGQFKVVLGHNVYQTLFPHQKDFRKQYISFLGQRFLVIGVLKKSGSNVTGINYDDGLILPYEAYSSLRIPGSATLLVKGKKGIPVKEVSAETEGILRAARKVAPGEKDNFSINQLSQVTQRVNSVFQMINVVGGIIAFFSLLVGGFGIANIMFVSVKERTKVIGLKKAIGAPSAVILTEFLIEAVMLCILGGLVGILLVVLLGLLITGVSDFTIIFSFENFIIGLLISTVVGLISGFIPARSAAKLNPVVAIRST